MIGSIERKEDSTTFTLISPEYVEELEKENKILKEQLETILDFDYFKNECPLNIGFGDELENKAQDVFYEDEYCESCKDDYKTCWLKYFKKLQELKEKYK